MFKSDVICVGSAIVDSFFTIDQKVSTVKLGDKVLVEHLERHSGGGATNSAAALRKLGLKVKVLVKLGRDHDAELIKKELKEYKIKNICLNKSKKNTDSATIVSSAQEKDRVIYVHKGASTDLKFNDFKKSQLKTKWIYLASLMGDSWNTAKEITKYVESKKINLLFNPSLYLAKKGKNYLKSVLRATYILVLNKEEAYALLGIERKNKNIKKVLLGLSKLGPEIVVITNGAKTLFAYNGQFYSSTPPKIKVINTAGSGDAFTAGFLAGLIKKQNFAEALQIGQANASSVIQHFGTKNKLLNLKEVKNFINKYKIRVNKNIKI